MNDLISRNKLIEHLNVCLSESDGRTPITDAVLTAIKCAVEQMPAVDAVEVVRCKDCEHFDTHWTYCGTDVHFCHALRLPIHETEYCSHGERKEVSE